MGIAAYNRGSKAIRESIARDYPKECRIAYEPKPVFPDEPLGPKLPVLRYWNLVDDPCIVEVGDRVYCTVTACRGWDVVTAIKGNRNDLRIKTEMHSRVWAYGHNFTRNPPEWMTKR